MTRKWPLEKLLLTAEIHGLPTHIGVDAEGVDSKWFDGRVTRT